MRRKGTDVVSSEDGDIPQWAPAGDAPASSDLLYANLEETFPPSPPFLERDPNMSSTARYSPPHSAHSNRINAPVNHLCNRNILTVGPYILSNDISQFMRSYGANVNTLNNLNTLQPNPLQSEVCDKLVPLLNAIEDVTRNDEALQSGIHETFYSQQTYNSNDQYDGPDAVYLTSSTNIDAISTGPILDSSADIQLVYSSEDMLNQSTFTDTSNVISKEEKTIIEMNKIDKFDEFTNRENKSENFSENDVENRRDRKNFDPDDISITCIPDKSVPCRAKASLPISHLLLGNSKKDDQSPLTVFARRRIPLRARFGPLEGTIRPLNEDTLSHFDESGPKFFVQIKNRNFYIDVSDEKTSNWMRYVAFRPGPDQNVCLQQLGEKLYFTSTKSIPPYAELILGYSAAYARRWSFPIESHGDDENLIEWACYECPKHFSSSSDLQEHLNSHDEDSRPPLRKPKKKIAKSVIGLNQRCNICNRVFPRNYSLKRHMKTHIITTKNASNELPPNSNEDSEHSNLKLSDFDSNSVKMESEVDSDISEKTCDQNFAMEIDDSVTNTIDSDCVEMIESNDYLESKENAIENENILKAHSLNSLSNNITNKSSTLHCSLCSKNFDQQALLLDHIKSEHSEPDKFHKCSKCDMCFQDFNGLNLHMKDNHEIQEFYCRTCSTAFNTSDELRLHLIKHSNHADFSCPNCGKQFKRKDKLKEHIKKQRRSINNNKEIIYLCAERANGSLSNNQTSLSSYLLFTFKCHPCRRGFKRRGMLVNHLARRHPEISRASVPELQLPILRKAREYFCQHCNKVYKSSSKRKAHILKNHPGESLPPSSRDLAGTESNEMETLGYSACVGAITSNPHSCPYAPCHKQYASKAKLSQHIRHKHLVNNSKNNKLSENAIDCDSTLKTDDTIIKQDAQSSSPTPSIQQDELLSNNDNINSQDVELSSAADKNNLSLFSLQQISTNELNILNEKTKINESLKQGDSFDCNRFNEDLLNSNKKVVGKAIDETITEDVSGEIAKISNEEILFNYDKASLDDYLCFGSNCLPFMVLLTPNIEMHDKNDLSHAIAAQDENEYIPNDSTKVHISGHIVSVESNKLHPMNILSSSKNHIMESSLGSQYTDR